MYTDSSSLERVLPGPGAEVGVADAVVGTEEFNTGVVGFSAGDGSGGGAALSAGWSSRASGST